MERLTIEELIDHCDRQMNRLPSGNRFYQEHESVRAYLQILRHYIATDLTPEQIKDADDFMKENYDMPLERFREGMDLIKAKDAGRLVVLQDGKATWIKAILAERDRQDEKWGYPQENTYCEWAAILAEETGELAKELNELNFGRGDVRRMETEAVQVAAVALSILEQSMVAYQTTVKVEDAIGRLTRQEAEEALREEGGS